MRMVVESSLTRAALAPALTDVSGARSRIRFALLSAAVVASFIAAYNLSPLYASNQNTKFVIGMARAGVGHLNQDFLAHTADPFPLFSLIVEFTHRFLSPWMFYVYAGALMAIYVYAMDGLARFVLRHQYLNARPAFLAMLIVSHCAALRTFFLSYTHHDVMGLMQDGWAGQYILGPFFQPSMFGVFLLVAVRWFLERRFAACLMAFAGAVIMHPAYLVIGTALLVGMIVSLLIRRHWKTATAFAAVGIASMTPMVLYLARSFPAADPETWARAQQVLMFERIPRHALMSHFLSTGAILQAAWVVAAIIMIRRTPLFVPFVLLVGVGIFMMVFAAAGSVRLLEVMPWRISALAVPLATAINLAWLAPIVAQRTARLQLWPAVAMVLCVVGGAVTQWMETDAVKRSPSYEVTQYVKHHAAAKELYVVPSSFVRFRLEAEAPTFVTFKSHPNRDVELLEWHRRYLLNEELQANPDPAMRERALDDLISREKATHFILRSDVPLSRKDLEPVYADASYTLYRLKQ